MFTFLKMLFWPIKEACKFLVILILLCNFTSLGNYVQIHAPHIYGNRILQICLTGSKAAYEAVAHYLRTDVQRTRLAAVAYSQSTGTADAGEGNYEKSAE